MNGEYGLGMKLHAAHIELRMHHGHHLIFRRARDHLQGCVLRLFENE